MTNRTLPVLRPGAVVRFGIPNTPACSNRTTNRTRFEREPNNEPNTPEPNTSHAHEPNKAEPFDPELNVCCNYYRAHQFSHRRFGSGWRCLACNPFEVTI
jgi:hypothetical protein